MILDWVKIYTSTGGWMGGEMEIKANLSQSLVEVEAELGNIKVLIYFCLHTVI